MRALSPHALPATASRLASGIARRLRVERQAGFWARELRSTWSPHRVFARVVATEQLTADTKTFVLEPNANWAGHVAGQFTTVSVDVRGTRVSRSYTLSSPPHEPELRITVRRTPGGVVSNYLHDHVAPGAIVELSQATGDFVVPPTPGPMIFIVGGSGVTPLLAILPALARRGELHDVIVHHHVRDRASAIAHDQLEALAATHGGLRVRLIADDVDGGFSAQDLYASVPDLAERSGYVCGPPGLVKRVAALWDRDGLVGSLVVERFAAPAPPEVGDDVTVTLHRRHRSLDLPSGQALLGALAKRGVHARSGCGMGICHQCVVRKRAGVVENTLTGAVSGPGDEPIQLCVSAARTDLVIEV